jgi:hypothetical protein
MGTWSMLCLCRIHVIDGVLIIGSNLEQALADSEALRKRSKEFPPVNSGVHRQATGLAGIIDEELGYLD